MAPLTTDPTSTAYDAWRRSEEIRECRRRIAALDARGTRRPVPLLTSTEQADVGQLEVRLALLEEERDRWLDSITIREERQ